MRKAFDSAARVGPNKILVPIRVTPTAYLPPSDGGCVDSSSPDKCPC